MTTYNKTTLKTFFETNDVPTGGDYANLIDSCLNVAETAIQTMAGAINPTEVVTPRVSAATGNFVNLQVTGALTASLASLTVTGVVSAASVNVVDVFADGTVYASAMRSVNGFIGGVGTVSAAGTTQGAAASLAYTINRGRGITDGTTTGFTPLTGRPGLVQYLLNEGASANLWPPTGGTINGLAVNAPFALATSAAYTIFHITASSYGVK